MVGPGDRAQERIARALPDGAAQALEGLSSADLTTVMLTVARARAARVRPAEVMRRWQGDRFVSPSTSDPRGLAALEARLWQLLPAEFSGVELSPVVPLGTCAAVAAVHQNRIVSTVRGTEVVSDSTTALALEAALRRREQGSQGAVHLAAAHRQLRAQPPGAGEYAHFRLFALVSSARDTGTAQTEVSLLRRQIRVWLDVLRELIPQAQPRIEVTCWPQEQVARRIRAELLDWVDDQALRPWVVEVPARTHGLGYYDGVALRLSAREGGVDLGDGGLTRWTARLLPDAKERCLVSCLSTERLLALTLPGS